MSAGDASVIHEARHDEVGTTGGEGVVDLTLSFNLGTINRRPDRHTNLVEATLNLRKKNLMTRIQNG